MSEEESAELIKQDALALAELIYDIYLEKKQNEASKKQLRKPVKSWEMKRQK